MNTVILSLLLQWHHCKKGKLRLEEIHGEYCQSAMQIVPISCLNQQTKELDLLVSFWKY